MSNLKLYSLAIQLAPTHTTKTNSMNPSHGLDMRFCWPCLIFAPFVGAHVDVVITYDNSSPPLLGPARWTVGDVSLATIMYLSSKSPFVYKVTSVDIPESAELSEYLVRTFCCQLITIGSLLEPKCPESLSSPGFSQLLSPVFFLSLTESLFEVITRKKCSK